MNLIAYIVLLVGLFIAEYLYICFARSIGAVHKCAQRDSHQRPTVVGGGVVFYVAALVAFGLDVCKDWWLIGGITALAAISFIDDLRPQKVLTRLIVQAIACSAILYSANCSFWWVIPALTFINACNFMDGINGLAGGYNALLLVSVLVADYTLGIAIDPLIICTLAACIVFCFFNMRTHPLCFAGDVGSITAAAIALWLLASLMTATGSLAYLVFVAVYGVDSSLTIIHRIILRRPIWRAHRMHLYEILSNEVGLPHLLTTAIYITIQLIINIGFLILSVDPYIYLGGVVALLSAIYIVLIRRFFPLHKLTD